MQFMNKKYQETEEKIILYTILFLNKNQPSELYNSKICQDLRISKHTFYNHFSNVSELYQKVIEFVQESMKTYLSDHYEKERDDISMFFSAFLDFLEEHTNYIFAYNKIKRDHGFSLVLSIFSKYLFISFDEDIKRDKFNISFFCGGVIRIFDEYMENHCFDREEVIHRLTQIYFQLKKSRGK